MSFVRDSDVRLLTVEIDDAVATLRSHLRLGAVMKKQAVLFLCTGNSARSVMAEALLRKHAGDTFDVYSAGTEPKGVNPLTVKALSEIGISTGQLSSNHVNEYLGRVPLDYMIVVCADADQKCPAISVESVKRLVWPFDDPAAARGTEQERLDIFRRVRDQIDQKIRNWLAEHGAPTAQ